eukprot:47389-Pyramimonas_sp.AAC.1
MFRSSTVEDLKNVLTGFSGFRLRSITGRASLTAAASALKVSSTVRTPLFIFKLYITVGHEERAPEGGDCAGDVRGGGRGAPAGEEAEGGEVAQAGR